MRRPPQRAALSAKAAAADGDDFAVADSMVNQASAAWVLGHHDEADAGYRQAARRFAGLGEDLQAAKAHGNRAGVLARRGRLRDAQSAYEDALSVMSGKAETQDVVRVLSRVQDNLALVLRERGRWRAALRRHRIALDLETRHGTAPEVAQGQTNVAAALWRLGSATEALVLLDAAIPVLRKYGDKVWLAAAQTERAVCRATLDDATGAGRDASSAVRFFRASQDHNGCGAALIASARVKVMHADLPGAILLLGEALDALAAGGDSGARSEVLELLGDCHLGAGRVDEAAHAYRGAVRLAEEAGTDGHLLGALRGWATCLRAQDDTTAADDASHRADVIEAQLAEDR